MVWRAAFFGAPSLGTAVAEPRPRRLTMTQLLLRVLTVAAIVSCSGVASAPVSLQTAPTASIAQPAPGVADRGNDPAVVAIDLAGTLVCAGALVASDVVLTAAHCVVVAGSGRFAPGAGAPTVQSPDGFGVRRQDASPFEGPRVAVHEIVVSPTVDDCNADVALLVLERPVDGAQPLSVRTTGVADGDHLRSVGYGG